jgi:hypothetical protein
MHEYLQLLLDGWSSACSDYSGIWLFIGFPFTILAASILAPAIQGLKPRPLLSSLGIALCSYAILAIADLTGMFLFRYIPNEMEIAAGISLWGMFTLVLSLVLFRLARREYRCERAAAFRLVVVWWVVALAAGLLTSVGMPSL